MVLQGKQVFIKLQCIFTTLFSFSHASWIFSSEMRRQTLRKFKQLAKAHAGSWWQPSQGSKSRGALFTPPGLGAGS